MNVKRFNETVRYDAPNHRGLIGLRLQGFEPDGPKNQREIINRENDVATTLVVMPYPPA
jgi:hypothetical protein